MACQCPPSNNIACSTRISDNNDSITVAQSECVILNDNTTQNNPYFDRDTNMSYWGYKVIVSCNVNELIAPNEIYIPIYENIDIQSLVIYERILSCGRFEPVSFDFSTPTGVTPPEGFKYIRIPVNDRYQRGVSVYYRVELMGVFPPEMQSILIEDTQGNILTFDQVYMVPGVPLVPSLAVMETTQMNINGNVVSIDYVATILNNGNVDLTDVMFSDVINYEGSNVDLGMIVVQPDTINVDTSVSGVIRLSGSIGDLAMGEMTQVLFTINIARFLAPGSYNFASTTMAVSGDTQNVINTMDTVEVVQFGTLSRCSFPESNEGDFTIGIQSIPDSPLSNITVTSIMDIPQTVIIQFLDFGGCQAVDADTGEPILLNTDVTNVEIRFTCDVTVPESGSFLTDIAIRVISTGFESNLVISSTMVDVALQEENSQVFLGAAPLPNEARIDVIGNTECMNTCN